MKISSVTNSYKKLIKLIKLSLFLSLFTLTHVIAHQKKKRKKKNRKKINFGIEEAINGLYTVD